MKPAFQAKVFSSTLRTRLFLSLLPFAAILVAVGAFATVIVYRLGRVMDAHRSVSAVRQMELAMDQMERVLLGSTKARVEVDAAVLDQSLRSFSESLEVQANNIRMPGEPALTRSLAGNFQLFRADVDQWRSNSGLTNELARLLPVLRSRRETLEQLLTELRHLNEEKSPDTTLSGWDVTQGSMLLLLAGTSVALLITVAACFNLARSLLNPIKALTDASHAVARGELDHPVPVFGDDELGVLARAFRQMAVEVKRYQENTATKMFQLNQKYEATLASFPDPIFVLDAEGRIESENPSAKHLAQTLGLIERLPPNLETLIDKVLQGGRDFLPEQFDAAVRIRVAAEDRFFLPRILLMRDDSGSLFGAALVLLDVTRFRLLDDAKTNLVGTVSHELRTPLTTIRMVLYMLLERTLGPLTPAQLDLVSTARDNSERVLRILNDLLDLSRLEHGQVELQLSAVSPAELLERAVAEQRDTAQVREIALEVKIDPDLPQVQADSPRIKYVFANLLDNAIKYSPRGGLIMAQAAETDNGGVRFSVRDQGPGIDPEYHGRIFDRFFRVPGQEQASTGLGLSIAREIVVAHGGRIGVNSEPGQGSEFFFILPAEKPEPAPAAANL